MIIMFTYFCDCRPAEGDEGWKEKNGGNSKEKHTSLNKTEWIEHFHMKHKY